MKKLSTAVFLAGILTFCSVPAVYADATSLFAETYEHTELLTNDLIHGFGKVFRGDEAATEQLVGLIDQLLKNTKILESSAIQMDKKDAADEARQMNSYLIRIQQAMRAGKFDGELTMLLARYYLHYNNCIMVNTIILKEMQYDHVLELQEAIDRNDVHEILHLAEHLHLHSDQMYYAATLFGKRIWKKFSVQAKLGADEIFEAAKKGDLVAVKTGLDKVEKAVSLLRRLIKE